MNVKIKVIGIMSKLSESINGWLIFIVEFSLINSLWFGKCFFMNLWVVFEIIVRLFIRREIICGISIKLVVIVILVCSIWFSGIWVMVVSLLLIIKFISIGLLKIFKCDCIFFVD